MPAPITLETIRTLPKVVLHDHLDGGLRPTTVIELADEIGWRCRATDPTELQAWFTAGADTGDLLQYLATFEHTLAVLQQRARRSPGRLRGRASTSPPTASSTPRCASPPNSTRTRG